jgi:addiction module HigA family antidote
MKSKSADNDLAIPHPGDVLREDYMKPLGLSACAVARALGVAPITVSLLVRGKRNVSPEMALRLARWSGASVEFWLGLQSFHDRRVAEREMGAAILNEVTPLASLQPA